MKGFLVAAALLASCVSGHIQMSKPYPIRSPLNPDGGDQKDYSYTNPLSTDGSDYPCKGYANDPFKSVADYTPGQTYELELQGSATHGGGSCQISLSYDKGKNFKVIHSMLGGCPITSKYNFQIPSDAPSGEALLAWSWFNKVGNREMYMNCAMVTIQGGSQARRHARDLSPALSRRAGGFDSLPPIFQANINGPGKCKTIEGQEVNFPLPGPSVEGSLSGKGYQCEGSAPFLGSGDSSSNSPKASSSVHAVASSATPSSSSHSTATPSARPARLHGPLRENPNPSQFSSSESGYNSQPETQSTPESGYKPQSVQSIPESGYKPQSVQSTLESGYKPQPESQSTPESVYKPEAQSQSTPGFGYKPQSESQSTPETVYKPEAQSQPKPEFGYKPQSESQSTPESVYKPEAQSQTNPQSEYKPQPESQSTPEFGYKPETMSQSTPESLYKPEAQSQSKPEIGYKPESESASKPESKNYPEAEHAIEPKPASQPASQPAPAQGYAEPCVHGEILCGPDGQTWAMCDWGRPVHMGLVAAGTRCRNGALERIIVNLVLCLLVVAMLWEVVWVFECRSCSFPWNSCQGLLINYFAMRSLP